MDNSKILLGALIFIVMVVGSNFVMYAIARGATRKGQGSGMLETFAKALNANQTQKPDEMSELRRTLEGLEGKKDKQDGDIE